MGLLDLLTDALDSLEAQTKKGFEFYAQTPVQGTADINKNQAETSPAPPVPPPPVSKRVAPAAQPAANPLFSSGQIASGIIMAEIFSKPVSLRRGRGRRGLDG